MKMVVRDRRKHRHLVWLGVERRAGSREVAGSSHCQGDSYYASLIDLQTDLCPEIVQTSTFTRSPPHLFLAALTPLGAIMWETSQSVSTNLHKACHLPYPLLLWNNRCPCLSLYITYEAISSCLVGTSNHQTSCLFCKSTLFHWTSYKLAKHITVLIFQTFFWPCVCPQAIT